MNEDCSWLLKIQKMNIKTYINPKSTEMSIENDIEYIHVSQLTTCTIIKNFMY